MGILYPSIIQGKHSVKRLGEDEKLGQHIACHKCSETNIIGSIRLLQIGGLVKCYVAFGINIHIFAIRFQGYLLSIHLALLLISAFVNSNVILIQASQQYK